MNSALDAWHELRTHPGRFWLSLSSIALAVALFCATQVFLLTELHATSAKATMFVDKADVVVSGPPAKWNLKSDVSYMLVDPLQEKFKNDPRVAAIELRGSSLGQVRSASESTPATLSTTAGDTALQTFTLTSGRWPKEPQVDVQRRRPVGEIEVAVSDVVAGALHVKVGDKVFTDSGPASGFAVSGIVTRPDRPSEVLTSELGWGFLIGPGSRPRSSLLIAGKTPQDGESLTRDAKAFFNNGQFLRITGQVQSRDEFRAAAFDDFVADSQLTNSAVAAFGLVSILVGGMVVASIMSISVSQRRRHIALMRAVGAYGTQMWSRLVWEAALLGTLGAAVGVPLGVGAAVLASTLTTHANEFGVTLPWSSLLLGAGLGLGVTVVASLIPAWRATTVRPVTALTDAPVEDPPLGSAAERLFLGAALVVAGCALAWWQWAQAPNQAVATPDKLAASISQATPAFVGVVLVVVGLGLTLPTLTLLALKVAARWGNRLPAPLALATESVARFPRRTLATSAALLVALGLLAAINVMATSAIPSSEVFTQREVPVDIALLPNQQEVDGGETIQDTDRDARQRLRGFRPGTVEALRGVPGVTDAIEQPSTQPLRVYSSFTHQSETVVATAASPELSRVSRTPLTVSRGAVGLSPALMRQLSLTPGSSLRIVPLIGNTIEPRVEVASVGDGVIVLPPEDLKTLNTEMRPGLIAIRTADGVAAPTLLKSVEEVGKEKNAFLVTYGGLKERAKIQQLLDWGLWVASGLLALAAIIAVAGQGTASGLSVIERLREIATLRALGLQRSGLRWWLACEAVLISTVAFIGAVLAGSLVGWLVLGTILRILGEPAPVFRINVMWLALAGGFALVAGVIASLIPANYSSRVPVTQALTNAGE